MSNDAVAYVYQNVGFAPNDKPQAVGYLYVNVGDWGVRSVVGRIKGIAFLTRHAVAYVYSNFRHAENDPPYAVGYVYMAVLEAGPSATRLLEDGTDRVLEDGTTTRNLE